MHEKGMEYKGTGRRATCLCGWVGKWHDAAIRGLPLADFRKHLAHVGRHGNERHDEYDFGNTGEMFAHLTDDHFVATAEAAQWDPPERVRWHNLRHAKDAAGR